MKKFISKLFLLGLLVIGAMCIHIILVFFVFAPQYSQEYTAAILDKVNRIETIDGSRIILVGDSNVAFGFNSLLIEQEFGIPVVNMGLHGGLSNAFHENMLLDHLHEGDLVVICHGGYDDNGKILNPGLAWITIENHWNLWKCVPKAAYIDMMKSLPRYLYKCTWLWITGTGNKVIDDVYARSAFNDYGDVAYERIGTEISFDGGAGVAWNDATVDHINELNQYCLECGAEMVIAGIPIGKGDDTTDEVVENAKIQWKEMSDKLDCHVISNIEDYFIEVEYFYNTTAHLNSEGADIRTSQLIEDLKKVIIVE